MTHSLTVGPDALDPARRQLNTHHADGRAPRRLHPCPRQDADARDRPDGFDLYSPTAPGEAFVTIDTAMYPGQTVAVGSTARGQRQENYASLANALAG